MYLLILWTLLLLNKVYAQNIDEKIAEYFKKEVVSTFTKEWQKQKAPFETATAFVLRENYGLRSLNIYVKHFKDQNKLSKGLLMTDNVVDLLIVDPVLREYPHYILPYVTYALASNIMTLKINLNRIFVDANYLLFRNDSVMYYADVQDPYVHSPFTFSQVMNRGQLTISVEHCILKGTIVTKLCGESVTIGADTFTLSNCKFNIEIFSLGLHSPPVLAPYFSDHQKFQLQNILIEPIADDLQHKVQGAIFNYINTSALFGADMPKFRFEQEAIIEETRNWMTKVVGKLNEITIERNQGVLPLEDLKINWNETRDGDIAHAKISLANMVLHGLDTAYSTNRGGPYLLQGLRIIEEISFSIMQIRGKISYEDKNIRGDNDFSTELEDLTVRVQLRIQQIDRTKEREKLHSSIKIGKITVNTPKAMEFSIVEPDRLEISHPVISGHLINTVPQTINNYLSKVLIEAIQATKGVTSGGAKTYSQTNEHSENKEITPEVDVIEKHVIDTKIDEEEEEEAEPLPSDDDSDIGKVITIDENRRKNVVNSKDKLLKKSLLTEDKLKQTVKRTIRRSGEGSGQISQPVKPIKNVTDNEIHR